MSSSQSASGFGAYLLPALLRAADKAGLTPVKPGPGADVVFNIVTHSDVGQWMPTPAGDKWLYR